MKYGAENSRIDLLLQSEGREDCFVEIKNVTAVDEQQNAIFPDAVSLRATRHLRELMHVVAEGQRGVIFFCIQREDIAKFRPADEIDVEYGKMLRKAIAQGVEAIAYKAELDPNHIVLRDPVPVVCS